MENFEKICLLIFCYFLITSFHHFSQYLFQKPIMLEGKKKSTLGQNQVDSLLHNIDVIEKILEDQKFLTGNELTIADFSFIAWIPMIISAFKIPEDRFPNITAWTKRLESLPCYDINRKALSAFDSKWAALE